MKQSETILWDNKGSITLETLLIFPLVFILMISLISMGIRIYVGLNKVYKEKEDYPIVAGEIVRKVDLGLYGKELVASKT